MSPVVPRDAGEFQASGCMWSLEEFQAWLEDEAGGGACAGAWQDVIRPAMVRIVNSTILAAQVRLV